MAPLIYEAAANWTLDVNELNHVHFIEVTTACTVTLPPNIGWVLLANWGAEDLTVNNQSAAAIGTLKPNQFAILVSLPNSSGEGAWPLKMIVFGADGRIFMAADIFFREGYPVVADDTDGNFYALETSTGSISETNQGSSESSVAEPDV